TIRYMAPERFEGRCDARGDVYALGLTLYELLAQRPAFDEPDRARLIRRVTQTSRPRLRELEPSVPRDLETGIHKAIERDPAHRYPSAGDLAEDLRRFLDDRPIRARRIPFLFLKLHSIECRAGAVLGPAAHRTIAPGSHPRRIAPHSLPNREPELI